MASKLKNGVLLAAAMLVSGHGALFIPPPRNAMDNILPEYSGGKSPAQGCTCTNGNGNHLQGCNRGLRDQGDGQSCMWWSQGCSIGCEKCVTEIEGFDAFVGKPPQADKIGFRTRYCNSTFNSAGSPAPLINSTLPRHAWTLNIGAEEGSGEDSYQYNPWRAPGYAPVADPCGRAGGKGKKQKIGGDSTFVDNKFAQMGDYGSKLPPSVNKTQWVAGTYVEVAWGPLYNHGGGYQYRLCPVEEALTEECFQRTPLQFDRTKQTLVWTTKAVPGADHTTPPVPAGGTLRFPVPAPVFVDEGTWPVGSTWARDPIPRAQDGRAGLFNASNCPGPTADSAPGCVAFPPPCPWDHGILKCEGLDCHGTTMGPCSSDWVVGLVSDMVLIPKDLKPGNYVLSWRWDCEETAQVWGNCADVAISSP